MTDKKYKVPKHLRPYADIVEGLGRIMGEDCEILLHDISTPGCSVVACANTKKVSGRTVGAPMTNVGLRMIRDPKNRDACGVYNYIEHTKDGRVLKSSVLFLRDEEGRMIDIICVNADMTKMKAARDALDALLATAGSPYDIQESFHNEVGAVVSDSINAIKAEYGSDLSTLTREEKIQIVRQLEETGFFLVKGAMERLSEEMKKSKYTLYGYLRKRNSG